MASLDPATHKTAQDGQDAPALFDVVRSPAPPGVPSRVRFDVPTGVEFRDAALDRVERSSREWQRAQVDDVLDELIRRGLPFSSNDARPLLPADVRPALAGARFLAAAKAGRIVRCGYVPSTSPRTHGHPVAVWQPVNGGAR